MDTTEPEGMKKGLRKCRWLRTHENMYFFKSNAFKAGGFVNFHLNTGSKRHAADQVFYDLLRAVALSPRWSKDLMTAVKLFLVGVGVGPFGPSDLHIKLCGTRAEVRAENERYLQQLSDPEWTYLTFDEMIAADIYDPEGRVWDGIAAETHVRLRVGAQVMLLRNVDDGLYNGSMGRVLHFMSQRGFNGIDTDRMEELGPGQSVADLENVWHEVHAQRDWPHVKFAVPGQRHGRAMYVQPMSFEAEAMHAEQLARRVHLPVAACWSMTVHKSEGLTLDRVNVNVGHIWCHGHLYTAMSRVRKMQDMRLTGFRHWKHMRLASLDVLDWIRSVHWHNVTV